MTKSIVLSGPPAVGKTTLSQILINYFGSKFVDIIELDSFHLYERSNAAWEKNTHLNPAMNDLNRYKQTILKLLKGENLIIKNYNHLTGMFDSETLKKIKNFLVIEGLHSLHFPDLTEKYDLNIYLELEEKLKIDAKMTRDLSRGRTKEDIKKQIIQRKSDYELYIKPQAKFSDIYICTKYRNINNYILEISFKSEYFKDFKNKVSDINGVNISNEILKDNKIIFNIEIDFNETFNYFKSLTVNLGNLESLNFQAKNYIKEGNYELLSKLGVILFMLEKKISEKI